MAQDHAGSAPAFTLTAAELSLMIERAVAAGMAAAKDERLGPELLSRNAIARAIGCSAAQVDKLRKSGMPTERVGQVPRFRVAACMAWIAEQKWAP
jgi:hypothetical protein